MSIRRRTMKWWREKWNSVLVKKAYSILLVCVWYSEEQWWRKWYNESDQYKYILNVNNGENV